MSVPLTPEQRWRCVILSRDVGWSTKRIAIHIPCTPRTVQSILALHRTTGGVAPRARSGRPRRLSDAALQRFNTALSSTPHAQPQELIDYVERHTGVHISRATLARERHRLGYHCVNERIVQELSAANIAKRLSFTAAHLTNNWHTVIFSDEKLFTLATTNNKMWVKVGDAVPVRRVKQFRAKVMVWAGVWYWGRTTIALVPHTINARAYQEVLADHLLPYMQRNSPLTFMQDNAPAHTARTTQTWLHTWAVPLLANWPPYSPELNPIESVWAWMTHLVNGARPTNLSELKDAIRHVWNELPQATIQSFIDHSPSVVRAVHAAQGNKV